jgi:probable F420-dependent oxidoreductase
MKVSVGFPIYGAPIERFGIDDMLAVVQESGVAGIWAGDHLALSRSDGSNYPGKATGKFFLDADSPWYEAFTALAYMAGATEGLEFGFSVALATLRPPLAVAKQTATLAAFSKGEVTLGVGAGWLKSEYEAVGVPFKARGKRLEDCVEVIRQCWTGEPAPGHYGDYFIPEGLTTYPVPPRHVPILIGGDTEVAYERAARIGDGWMGMLQAWDDGDTILAPKVERVRELWAQHRPDAEPPMMGVIGPAAGPAVSRDDFPERLAERLEAYSRMGLEKVVLSIGWRDLDSAGELLRLIAATAKDVQAHEHERSRA